MITIRKNLSICAYRFLFYHSTKALLFWIIHIHNTPVLFRSMFSRFFYHYFLALIPTYLPLFLPIQFHFTLMVQVMMVVIIFFCSRRRCGGCRLLDQVTTLVHWKKNNNWSNHSLWPGYYLLLVFFFTSNKLLSWIGYTSFIVNFFLHLLDKIRKIRSKVSFC